MKHLLFSFVFLFSTHAFAECITIDFFAAERECANGFCLLPLSLPESIRLDLDLMGEGQYVYKRELRNIQIEGVLKVRKDLVTREYWISIVSQYRQGSGMAFGKVENEFNVSDLKSFSPVEVSGNGLYLDQVYYAPSVAVYSQSRDLCK